MTKNKHAQALAGLRWHKPQPIHYMGRKVGSLQEVTPKTGIDASVTRLVSFGMMAWVVSVALVLVARA